MNVDSAFRSALYLLGLWFAVYYLWPDYRHDAFRQHVFSIRNRMFLYAAQGNISFDHPAYRILRNRMNAILRHGDEFTLTRMILILITHPRAKPDVLVAWEESLTKLPKETQAKLKEFELCVSVAVLQHVVFRSFFRYLVFRPLISLLNPFQVREIAEKPKVAESVERLESLTLEKEKGLLPPGFPPPCPPVPA